MLNGITGQDFPTSNSAIGCTFQSTSYPPVKFSDGNYYEFIDTVGLNEGTKGTVVAQDAMKKLFRLILKNSQGFSLFIMVIKASRLDAGLEKNYKLFVKELVEGKVPVILIITQCEFGPSGEVILDLDQWLTENKTSILSYGFHFNDIVSTSWAKSPIPAFENEYLKLRKASQEKAIRSIMSNSLNKNISFALERILETLRRVWNFVATIYHFPKYVGSLGEILMSMGFSRTEAAELESSIRSFNTNL